MQTSNTILTAHPIDPAVRQRVMQALDEIEARHEVRVLFACESGSRGWGFASPDSDYDVRFVYVPRMPWYLRVEAQRDVIELPISDELDVSGWELRKALRLLRRSNPTLLEWLDSPVIYRERSDAAAGLRALAAQFFSPMRGRYHYLAMAKKNFQGYLRGDTVRLKKYLYVLRPLLAVQWIDEYRSMPPMRFAELAQATISDETLRDEINRLLAVKMRVGETEHGPRWPAIHAYIEGMLAQVDRDVSYRTPQGDTEALDRFLLQTVMTGDSHA